MILRSGEQPVPGYRLQQRLGRGAIGEVWRASGPGGTAVALKFVNLAGKPAIKELRALQHVKLVRHANLTPIHAFWMLDPNGDVLTNEAVDAYHDQTGHGRRTPSGLHRPTMLIIAMQIGDKSLTDRLEECKKEGLVGIPVEELLGYLEDAAKGLDFLNSPRHDLGSGPAAIQHCDVKPQNILLMGDSASVCDFGLARVLGESHTTSAMAGSPAYMAPECIDGPKPSGATDQYSLAVSYVELRTGQLPFSDLSYGEVLHAHLTGGLYLDRLAPPEREVIRRALSRDPAARYATSVALVKMLRRAVEGLSLTGSITSTGGSLATMAGALTPGANAPLPPSIAPPPPILAQPAPPPVQQRPVAPSVAPAPPAVAKAPVAAPIAASGQATSAPKIAAGPPPANANELKMRVAQLTRDGQFDAALQTLAGGAALLAGDELAQLQNVVASRWFARVIDPLVEKRDFMGALAAINGCPQRIPAERKAQWLADMKARWTRFAADQLKRGRGK
jgi:serine/threonine protein kinase